MKKRLLPLLLALCLMLSFPLQCFAATTDPEPAPTQLDNGGSKISSKAKLTKDDRETEITLSLPSAEYKHVIDVVFVMDKSTSTAAVDGSFTEMVNNLLNQLEAKNVDTKLGIVKFRGLAEDMIKTASEGAKSGLIKIEDSTRELITTALNTAPTGNGTNVHGALTMANDMLAADTEVDDSNKYVFLLTDGKTYIWDDNGVATSIYAMFYSTHTLKNKTQVKLDQNSNHDKGDYAQGDPTKIVNFNSNPGSNDPAVAKPFQDADFLALYNSTNPELSTKTKYDGRCGYAYGEGSTLKGSIVAHATTNGAEIFPIAGYEDYRSYYEFVRDEGEDTPVQDANPYEVVIDPDTGEYSFDPTKPNEDFYMYHVSALEKGLYKSAHLWKEMVDSYNAIAIYDRSWGQQAGLGIAYGFATWLDDVSDFAANIKTTGELKNVFDSVCEDMLYLVDSGVVEDQITEKFDLVIPEEGCPFTMTLNGTELTATETGENAWSFADGDYTIAYTPDTRTFLWTLNVPVENAKPVTLSYKLLLNDLTKDLIQYPTNDHAKLDYVSTTGEDGTFTFPVPKIDYVVPQKNPPTGDHTAVITLSCMAAVMAALILTEVTMKRRARAK